MLQNPSACMNAVDGVEMTTERYHRYLFRLDHYPYHFL